MSPPEVWGPAIWRLFHTLAENINENVYQRIYPQLFYQIQRICKFLPCPECAKDASIFLGKVKLSDLKTKTEFKNIFYLFHNYVNAKKRKPLFNYANINIYKSYRIINVVNNFIAVYNTKGNMKLIAESFQRQFVIKEFKIWIMNNINFFIPVSLRVPLQNETQPTIVEPEPVEEIQESNISDEILEPVEEIQESNISDEILESRSDKNNDLVNSSEDVALNEGNISSNDVNIEEIYNEITLEESVAPIIKKKENKKNKKNKKRVL
jgi:hypothetical protein